MTLAEEEGAEDKLIRSLIGEAVKSGLRRSTTMPSDYESITEQFQGNLTFPAGDDLSAEEFVANMKAVKGLHAGRDCSWRRRWNWMPAIRRCSRASGNFCLKGCT